MTSHNIEVLGKTEVADDKLGPIPVVIVEGIGHAVILGRGVLATNGAHIDYTPTAFSHGGTVTASQSCCYMPESCLFRTTATHHGKPSYRVMHQKE